MSVRLVFAVILAVALCSVASPAIDHARTNRAEYRADAATATISRSVTDLADESAVPLGDHRWSGARRVVSLSLPAESMTTAKIEFVSVGGIPGSKHGSKDEPGGILAYRVEGGPTHRRHVPLDVRIATKRNGGQKWNVRPDGTPLVVHASDRTDIALLLVEYRGRRTVLVVPAAEV